MPDLDSPKRIIAPQPENIAAYHHNRHLYSCNPELKLHYTTSMPHDSLFLPLPQLESPKLPAYINSQGSALQSSSSIALEDAGHHLQTISVNYNNSAGSTNQSMEQVTDWRALDKFVASQLSQDIDASKGLSFQVSDKQEAVGEYASTSNSSGQIDLWK